MDSFEQKILDTIEENALFTGGEPVVAAVSGGADSVALLMVLKQISSALNLTLFAAHANHQLRGQESEEDQRFVEDLCMRIEVPLESRRISTGNSQPSRNLEDAARQGRYAFLTEIASSKKAILATGHNKNDQAETFLMKLLRGAGPSGLSGIFIKREHPLSADSVDVVRPLLEVSREEIVGYLERTSQPFREDSTNSQLHFDRNWIRHQLIPTLADRFNPSITGTLARNAKLFGEIQQYLDDQSEQLLEGIGREVEGGLLLHLPEFNQSPIVLRKQVARQAIHRVKGDLLDIGQNHIQALLGLCTGTSGRKIHLPGNVRVSREFDDLRIGIAGETVARFEYYLQLPGQIHLPEIEKKVVARRVPLSARTNRNLLSVRLETLIVRNRRPGDRYLFSENSSEKGLKRLFLERRVPISERDRLVIFESERRIVWIEGFPPNPDALVSESDSEGIEIEIVNETFSLTKPSK